MQKIINSVNSALLLRLVIEATESKKSSVSFSPRSHRLKTKEKSKVNSNDLVDNIINNTV